MPVLNSFKSKHFSRSTSLGRSASWAKLRSASLSLSVALAEADPLVVDFFAGIAGFAGFFADFLVRTIVAERQGGYGRWFLDG